MERIAFALLVALAATHAVPVEKQIVDGQDAAACEFPHMVSIGVRYKNKGSSCGATLISNQHILTAAHCVDDGVLSITAHVGSNTRHDPSAAIPVRQWAKHRGFAIADTVINDVAILQLSRPVQFSSCIQPMDLPKRGDQFTGTCIAAGWGKTGKERPSVRKLQRTDINIIPTNECKKTSYAITHQQHICVGNQRRNEANVCNGDSGGGLICQRVDGTPVVAGVASYVHDCDSGFGVFANVENFLDFIEDHVAVWQ